MPGIPVPDLFRSLARKRLILNADGFSGKPSDLHYRLPAADLNWMSRAAPVLQAFLARLPASVEGASRLFFRSYRGVISPPSLSVSESAVRGNSVE